MLFLVFIILASISTIVCQNAHERFNSRFPGYYDLEAKAIDLAGKKLEASDMPLVAALLKLFPDTKILRLDDNLIGPDGAKALQNLLAPSLVELSMSGCQINGEGVIHLLAPLSKMKNLEKLLLSGNQIGAGWLKDLAKAIAKATKLKQLDLSNNGISDYGAKDIASAISETPNLRVLQLQDNNIGIVGSKALAKSLPKLLHLQSVNLSSNDLKGSGLIALENARTRMTWCTSFIINEESPAKAVHRNDREMPPMRKRRQARERPRQSAFAY